MGMAVGILAKTAEPYLNRKMQIVLWTIAFVLSAVGFVRIWFYE